VRLDEAKLQALVPAGRSLYVRIQAQQNPAAWREASAGLGFGAEISDRVQDVCIFDTPLGGHLTLVSGSFPISLIPGILIDQGWVPANGNWPWQLFQSPQGNRFLALLADGILLIGEGDTQGLEWYVGWQKGWSVEKGGLPAYFSLNTGAALIQISTDLGGVSNSFHRLELGIFLQDKAYVLSGRLIYDQAVPERQVRSTARLILLQIFQLLGFESASLSNVRISYAEEEAIIQDYPLGDKELIQAMSGLAQSKDMR
jgi:hypothetical protein